MAKRDLLSAKEVQQAKYHGSKNEWLNDGDGLRLRIRANGKAWYFVYKPNRHTNEVHIKLGDYPVLSLKDARERSEVLRKIRANGRVPLQELLSEKQALEEHRRQEDDTPSMDTLLNYGIKIMVPGWNRTGEPFANPTGDVI